jgi:GTP-binding protein Era
MGKDDSDGAASKAHRCGYVAIVGRPNVGKSTLLNRILGRKIAIVTPKPQTTRRRILGIKTLPGAQLLFLDTPGLHAARGLMNERMVARARQAVTEADVVLWLVDASRARSIGDREMATWLAGAGRPVVIGLNKIDCLSKNELLPLLDELARSVPAAEVVPVSALSGENLTRLLDRLCAVLPQGPALYPEDEVTDETEREIVAEIIREKVMLETRDEIPYAVAVTVDAFEEKEDRPLVIIRASIHVDRESQKPIVIGQRGARIKAIGQAARAEIEAFLERRVFLELFVKVQPGWTRQPARLKEFGV